MYICIDHIDSIIMIYDICNMLSVHILHCTHAILLGVAISCKAFSLEVIVDCIDNL